MSKPFSDTPIPEDVVVSDYTTGGDRMGAIPLMLKARAWEKLRGIYGRKGFYQEGIFSFHGYSAAQLGNTALNLPGHGARAGRQFHYGPSEIAEFYFANMPEILLPKTKNHVELYEKFNTAAAGEFEIEKQLTQINRGKGRRDPALFFHLVDTVLNGAKLGDLVRPHTISAQGISDSDSLIFTNHADTAPPFHIYEPNQRAALLVVASAAHPLLFPSIPIQLENSNIGTDSINVIDGGFFDSHIIAEAAIEHWFPDTPTILLHWDCGYTSQTYNPEDYDRMTGNGMFSSIYDLFMNKDIWFSTLREYMYGHAKASQKMSDWRLRKRGDGSRQLSVTFEISNYIKAEDERWVRNPGVVDDMVVRKIRNIGQAVIEEKDADGTLDKICEALEYGRRSLLTREFQAKMNDRPVFPSMMPEVKKASFAAKPTRKRKKKTALPAPNNDNPPLLPPPAAPGES